MLARRARDAPVGDDVRAAADRRRRRLPQPHLHDGRGDPVRRPSVAGHRGRRRARAQGVAEAPLRPADAAPGLQPVEVELRRRRRATRRCSRSRARVRRRRSSRRRSSARSASARPTRTRELPVQPVSTGICHLMVPVRDHVALERARPEPARASRRSRPQTRHDGPLRRSSPTATATARPRARLLRRAPTASSRTRRPARAAGPLCAYLHAPHRARRERRSPRASRSAARAAWTPRSTATASASPATAWSSSTAQLPRELESITASTPSAAAGSDRCARRSKRSSTQAARRHRGTIPARSFLRRRRAKDAAGAPVGPQPRRARVLLPRGSLPPRVRRARVLLPRPKCRRRWPSSRPLPRRFEPAAACADRVPSAALRPLGHSSGDRRRQALADVLSSNGAARRGRGSRSCCRAAARAAPTRSARCRSCCPSWRSAASGR